MDWPTSIACGAGRRADTIRDCNQRIDLRCRRTAQSCTSLCFSASRGRRGSESVHVPRRQPTAAGSSFTSRIRFPTILGWHRRCLRNAQTAALPRRCACVLLRQAPTSTRPWVGHRLRRLCSAEERKARGPRAQRASCSDSLRLSERSERSSRSEFRNGATRSSTTGNPACKAGRCIRSRRRWPTHGPCPPQTKLTTTGRYAPGTAEEQCAYLMP